MKLKSSLYSIFVPSDINCLIIKSHKITFQMYHVISNNIFLYFVSFNNNDFIFLGTCCFSISNITRLL